MGWLQLQIKANNHLGADAATLPLVVGSTHPTDLDPYLTPRPDGDEDLLLNLIAIKDISEKFPIPHKSKLFNYINMLINVHCACILLLVTLDIFAITYEEVHSRFSH